MQPLLLETEQPSRSDRVEMISIYNGVEMNLLLGTTSVLPTFHMLLL